MLETRAAREDLVAQLLLVRRMLKTLGDQAVAAGSGTHELAGFRLFKWDVGADGEPRKVFIGLEVTRCASRGAMCLAGAA